MTNYHQGTTQEPPAPLLTVKDVASLLKVSVRTLRRHIAAEALSVVRIGRSIRVKPEAVQAFVTGQGRG
jgi:excisionase family DNA binding protein